MSNTKKAALYVRVSTRYQEDKDSIPHQIKELEGYCRHVLHIDDTEVFSDVGKSGKNTDRPAFQRMMKKARSGQLSHVLVYKIDRISRNLVDFSLMYDEFKKNRVVFISLNEQFDTSSAMGEAMLKIILIFAELERKMTSERVSDIMMDRAQNGLWNGANVPFGYRWDEESKFPVPDPVEADVVKLIFNLYEETSSSCKIRDYLNRNNIRTKRDGEWTSKTVADIIRNPFYKGTYRYNYRESPHGKIKPEKEWIVKEHNHTAIIDDLQYERCNRTMDQNSSQRRDQGFSHKRIHIHVFSGALVCSSCGAYFQAAKKDKGRSNGFAPSMYRCGNRFRKRSCNASGCSDVVIGPFFFNYVSNMVQASRKRAGIRSLGELEQLLLSGPEFSGVVGIVESDLENLFVRLLGRRSSASFQIPPLSSDCQEDDAVRVNTLQVNQQKYLRALERLKNAYLFDDGGMDEKEYLSTKRDLEVKLVEINNQIAELEESSFSSTDETAFIASASSFLLTHKLQTGEHIVYSSFAASIDDQALHDFVHTVVDRISVHDGRVNEIIFKNGLRQRFLWRE